MKRLVAGLGALFSLISFCMLSGEEASPENKFLAKSFMKEQGLLVKETKGFHWSHGTRFRHRSRCGHHNRHGHHGCHGCCGHHGRHGHHH